MSDWTPTDRKPPPNSVEVDTMDSGGHVQRLVREGNLYWFADKSMYVYYAPKLWRLPEREVE